MNIQPCSNCGIVVDVDHIDKVDVSDDKYYDSENYDKYKCPVCEFDIDVEKT